MPDTRKEVLTRATTTAGGRWPVQCRMDGGFLQVLWAGVRDAPCHTSMEFTRMFTSSVSGWSEPWNWIDKCWRELLNFEGDGVYAVSGGSCPGSIIPSSKIIVKVEDIYQISVSGTIFLTSVIADMKLSNTNCPKLDIWMPTLKLIYNVSNQPSPILHRSSKFCCRLLPFQSIISSTNPKVWTTL